MDRIKFQFGELHGFEKKYGNIFMGDNTNFCWHYLIVRNIETCDGKITQRHLQCTCAESLHITIKCTWLCNATIGRYLLQSQVLVGQEKSVCEQRIFTIWLKDIHKVYSQSYSLGLKIQSVHRCAFFLRFMTCNRMTCKF